MLNCACAARMVLCSCHQALESSTVDQRVSFYRSFWTDVSCQMQFYQSLELFIEVRNDLMTFPGEGNTLLWVFQRCCVHNHVQCGTGILLQLTRFNRRRHDILKCPWKSKYFWYRDINYYSSANRVEAWAFDQPSNYNVPCLIDFPQLLDWEIEINRLSNMWENTLTFRHPINSRVRDACNAWSVAP